MRNAIRNLMAVSLAGILAVVGIALAPAAMAATGKITGKVTWAGPAPENLYVDLYTWDDSYQYWAATGDFVRPDATGAYTIEDVAPGTYTVAVWDPRYSTTWLGNSVREPLAEWAAVTIQVTADKVTSGVNIHLAKYKPTVTVNLTNFMPGEIVGVTFYNITEFRDYYESSAASATGEATVSFPLSQGQYWVIAQSNLSGAIATTVRSFAQRGLLTVGADAVTLNLAGEDVQSRLYTPWPTLSGNNTVGATVRAYDEPQYSGSAPALSPTMRFYWTDGTRIVSTTNELVIPASVVGTEFPGLVVIVEAPGQASKVRFKPLSEAYTMTQLGTAPFPTTLPGISGEARVGATLKVQTGTWSPTPASFTYQWLRNGSAISGATTATYKLGVADVGTRISLRIAGVRPGHTSAVTTTGTTAAVAKATAKVKIKPAKKKVKKGKRAKVTVRVKARGTTPTGRVLVKFGSKKIKAKLKKGRAVVRSPKLANTGSVKVTVKYAGSKAVAKAKKTTKLVVR